MCLVGLLNSRLLDLGKKLKVKLVVSYLPPDIIGVNTSDSLIADTL